jgi:hypothetical protein
VQFSLLVRSTEDIIPLRLDPFMLTELVLAGSPSDVHHFQMASSPAVNKFGFPSKGRLSL